jgi:hypothetical protein
MKVLLTLRPGQRGTKALVAEYGEQLVCVRYRYDSVAKKRYKTIEVVIESGTWYPSHEPDDMVAVRLSYDELSVQTLLKSGGRWDAAQKLWLLRYHVAVGLGLIDRIVD